MKKTVRNLFAIILLVALLAGTLSACGKDPAANQETNQTTGADATAAANSADTTAPANVDANVNSSADAADSGTVASDAGIGAADAGTVATPPASDELDFVSLVMITPGDQMKDIDIVQDEWNKYFKEKLNCEVKMTILEWDTEVDQITRMLAAGEQLDLIYTASWSGYYSNYVARGALEPLDDLLEKYGQPLKQAINPNYLIGPRVGGKLYMIPVNKEIAEGRAMLVYPPISEEFPEFNFKDMKGMDDLKPALEAISARYPGEFILSAEIDWYGQTNKSLEKWESGNFDIVPGYEFLVVNNETHKVECLFDNDWYNEKFYLYKEWYDKGYINKDQVDRLIDEESAIMSGQNKITAAQNKPGYAEECQIAYGFSSTPILFTGYTPKIETYSSTGSGYGISANSANKERAMMVLNALWTDPELLNIFMYGIEGVHYTRDPGSEIVKLPANVTSGADLGWTNLFSWMIGNQFLNYVREGEPLDKFTQYQAFNDNAKVSKVFGFYFDNEPVKNEVSAVLQAWENNYKRLLEVGRVNDVDAAIAKINAEMRAAGLDTVMGECQRQLDEWYQTQ